MEDEELLRFSRQIMLPEIEIAGQEALNAAHVLVVGVGGLGSPVALYLAAAGIGKLTLLDHDEVDLTNLQRQIVHTTAAIGDPKVESAARTLEAINPGTEIVTLQERADETRLNELVVDADLVVDCTDNFTVRFEINRACVASGTPLVSGAAIRLEGQIMVYDPGKPDCACYQCLYQEAEDGALNCAETGVAAPVVGVIGTLQAMEVLKLIAGFGESLAGYVLVYDAKYSDFRKLKLPRNPDCAACGS